MKKSLIYTIKSCIFYTIMIKYPQCYWRGCTDECDEENEVVKNWADMLKNITMLTQFGLSFVTPVFLCLALCWWLNIHMGVGAWVYIPGFFFGLGGSFTVAYKLYLKIMEEQKKEDKKKHKKVSFNRHV